MAKNTPSNKSTTAGTQGQGGSRLRRPLSNFGNKVGGNFRKGLSAARNAKDAAADAAKHPGKAMGKMAKKVGEKVVDKGLDAAGKGLSEFTGGLSIAAAELAKRHKKEALVLTLLSLLSSLLPLLFFFFLIIGAPMVQLYLQGQNQQDQLTITKSGPVSVPNPPSTQSNLSYTITANYPGAAQDVKIVDTIPSNAQFVSATGKYTTAPLGGGPGTKTVTWSAADNGAAVGGALVNGGNTGTAPSSGKTFTATGTGYYPANNALEGGLNDMRGKPLQTLQDFLGGKATYVSVAMDTKAFPYGTELSIKELDQKYGKHIKFLVVDTGGAFVGKGTSRIDICTANQSASLDPTINGKLTITAGNVSTVGGTGGISFSVTIILKPTQNDSYVINQASGEVVGANGGSTAATEGNLPPNTNDCGFKDYKKYMAIEPSHQNYGDPSCMLVKRDPNGVAIIDKDQILTQLKTLKPSEAMAWFTCIVPRESGYNANAYLKASTSGFGAYGLVQMNPTGKGHGQYDNGEVNWQLQLSNGINYNDKVIGHSFNYWPSSYKSCLKGFGL